jgi:hypothetical protein
MCRTLLVVFTLVSLTGSVASGQQATTGALRPGAKVFINSMPDDFDSFLKARIQRMASGARPNRAQNTSRRRSRSTDRRRHPQLDLSTATASPYARIPDAFPMM